MTRVLIVDDEPSICWGLETLCQQMSLESVSASSAERGLELADKDSIDLILLDVRLPGMDGLTAIEQFHQRLGHVPIIVMTAFGDLKTAIQTVKLGAFEYLVKPFELEQVRRTIQQALAAAKLANTDHGSTSAQPKPDQPDLRLVGSSPIMNEVYKQIAMTTTTTAPVLITGESGTGKELTARSIHQFGSRSNQPFVAVNIAALNPALAESELFGHKKGAFTGADNDRQGLIQQAHGGTLFLDEVAEIPLELQVKLLRVLDQNEVIPVGSNDPVKTDFRLISATHQDLLRQVNHGEFRHDLFYRLRTFEIHLPALRERKSDIPELVDYFVTRNQQQLTIAPEFLEQLARLPWPGNVRQLQSVVDRAITLARGGVLTVDHLEQESRQESLLPAGQLEEQLQLLVQRWVEQNWDLRQDGIHEALLNVVEPALLATAFRLADKQYSAAARKLGIQRTTLKKKLEELE